MNEVSSVELEKGYIVYSSGVVFNRFGREIGTEHPCGYVYVHIGNKMLQRDRLIATYFVPNPENKPYVDHINHRRNDDRAENLRWVTDSENQRNRIKKEDITPEIEKWLAAGREKSRKYNKRKKQKIADAKYEEYPRLLEF